MFVGYIYNSVQYQHYKIKVFSNWFIKCGFPVPTHGYDDVKQQLRHSFVQQTLLVDITYFCHPRKDIVFFLDGLVAVQYDLTFPEQLSIKHLLVF